MPGLIEEVQRDALDKNMPVDALLRKLKLAAAKLNLEVIESWVDQELNGYCAELPKYRKVHGQPAGWSPYNGWVPIYIKDEKIMELVSEARISQSIASIQDLIEHSAEGVMHFPVDPARVAAINSMLNFETPRIVVQIGRGSIVSIVDAVRNMVLDWAIEMEKKGVLGDGMSFDFKEKIQAQHVMNTFNISNNGNFFGSIGDGNIFSDVSVDIDAVQEIKDFIRKVSSSQNELVQSGVDKLQLSAKIKEIEKVLNENQPKSGLIKRLLNDVREILTAAAGNLTADGAIALIASITSALR